MTKPDEEGWRMEAEEKDVMGLSNIGVLKSKVYQRALLYHPEHYLRKTLIPAQHQNVTRTRTISPTSS